MYMMKVWDSIYESPEITEIVLSSVSSLCEPSSGEPGSAGVDPTTDPFSF